MSKLVQSIETTAESTKLIRSDVRESDARKVTAFDKGEIIGGRLWLRLITYQLAVAPYKDNPFHGIELIANNEGDISPDTAYKLILTSKERYEFQLSSEFSVNA